MAAMLVRVFGCTAGKDIAHFTDVSTTAWYYSELSTAAQMNIFNGYGDGTMGPNRSITRQEAMVVIARAFAVPDGTAADIQAFRDASSVGSWAVAKVGGLVKAGIVNGDNGSLYPTASITRARSRRCSIISACSFAPMPLRSRPPAASFIPAPRP